MTKNPRTGASRSFDDTTRYRSRITQITSLAFESVLTVVDDPKDPDATGASLELFIKEKPRGKNYVSDFVYSDPRLSITVLGVLLGTSTGLVIGELELFRAQWGYFDDYGDYVGPDGDWRAKDDDEWDVSARSDAASNRPRFDGITGATLRSIPVGRILAWAQDAITNNDWQANGLTMLSISGKSRTVPVPELGAEVRAALERTAAVPTRRQGRPPLPDDLLEEIAWAYLEEAKRGRGLTRRLAIRFDRPEETVRDWIHACRRRGYLSPGVTGRRGAQPGDRLLANRPEMDEEE